MRLYSMPSSGNSYKVRLLLSLLDLKCEIIDVEYGSQTLDSAKAEGKLPFGKAPVLITDGGRFLPESNAILLWLGDGTCYIPEDPADRAEMLGWMFWEQNQHEGTIAVRAALNSYAHRRHLATPERMAELLARGHELLGLMENRLSQQKWLVANSQSLADICLYAYTHTAGTRGGYDLAQFPGILAWIDRVTQLPGYQGIDA